jgi:hypothetical protein
MKKDKILYALTVEDVKNVAEEYLERKLSDRELRCINDKLGDFIDWGDAVINALIYAGIE